MDGVFYYNAGRQFTSPLINTAMDGEDFLKFVSNPQYYVSHEITFFKYLGRPFPIGRIDDVEVNFVHYKTEDSALEAWKRRVERIIWDNIFILVTNHDGM